MAKNFRLRHLTARVPFLDKARRALLVFICEKGTNFFCRSYRQIKVVAPGARAYLAGQKQAIFAIYHGRMVGLPELLLERSALTILISLSRDGEIIARAISRLGFSIARGSPAKGAVEGGLGLIRAARVGKHLVLTVDGPRGPIYKVKPGVIKIAQLTGLPVIPCVCSARTISWMWGWDKFMGPWWATPLLNVYGEPIFVPPFSSDSELSQARCQLEDTLSQIRDLADSFWEVGDTGIIAKKLPLLPVG